VKSAVVRLILVVLLSAFAVPVSGCDAHVPGRVSAAASDATEPGAPATSSMDGPSDSARMVCAEEAQQEIEAALGVHLSEPLAPTWLDYVYSCRYVFPTGVIVLAVKELPDAASTLAYFMLLQNKAGQPVWLEDLGEAAFAGPDGSAVVRKDFKVLQVDVSGLPDKFGQSSLTRAEAARQVAIVIMECWPGG